MGMKCKKPVLLKCCLCSSVFTFVTAVLIIAVFPVILRHEIYKSLQIREGSMTYDAWKSPPFPLYFEFYLFDVLNKEEVIRDGAKIAVQQKGPYTYRLYSDKTNITFNNNGTVSYVSPTVYTFEPDRSAGPETEIITTVNFIVVTIANNIRYEYDFVKKSTAEFLDIIGSSDLFMEKSVHDILWGFEDDTLKRVKEVMTIAGIPFDDHFGFFYQQNNSNNGLWNIETGENGHDTMFDINYWNFSRSVPYWTTESCNTITGTGGNMFRPFQNEDSIPNFFFQQLCRNFYVTYDSKQIVKGVHTYRYVQPPEVFENPSKNPDNKGYCTPENDCLPNGLCNISNCRKGAPFSLSLPHFLFADDDVINGVTGMKPDIKLHQPFSDIVPELGTLINTERKYQINMYVRNMSWFKPLSKIKNVHFPVFWFNESTILDEKWSRFIRSYMVPVAILPWVGYTLAVIGLIGSCISIYCVWRQMRIRKQNTKTTEQEDTACKYSDKTLLINSEVLPNGDSIPKYDACDD